MTFLAPLFLIGIAAIGGPILFHLIRRSARERMPFSSLMFLRLTPPRATRRRKLEHLLLLMLRCLALILLAAAFARPLWPRSAAPPPASSEGRQLVVLVDTSASMRREGLWPKARALADKYLKNAAPADRVAVMTFAREPHLLVSFEDWASWPADRRNALARARLDALAPSWEGTHLGLALTRAVEQFFEDLSKTGGPGPRAVALISDLQEGAKLDGLQGYDWPKGVQIIVERVDPAYQGNAGLAILDPGAGISGDERPRVRVTNSRDSAGEKFVLEWSNDRGALGAPTDIYVPPGQTRTLVAPEMPKAKSESPAADGEGSASATGTLQLVGDRETYDNTAYFVAPEKEKVSIAYLGQESANDSSGLLYYLQRAFPETPRRQVRVASLSSNTSPASLLLHAALAVIPSALGAGDVQVVHEWLASGRTALLVLTNAQSATTLTGLAGWQELDVREADGDYALLGDVDFNHPLFAPFADPRFSDFSRIHFWKHRRWSMPPNSPARVLARFDDGTPALAQIAIGKGTLLALFAGWNPADSQLALSTKFVPLMQTLLDWTGNAVPARTQFEIGDSLPCPRARGEPLSWRKPDGKEVRLSAGAPFTETDVPGIYTVQTSAGLRCFAVNLSADESRTAPMSLDDLAVLGVPLGSVQPAAAPSPSARRRLLLDEEENRQKLWRWMLVALLGVVTAEVLLGGWFAKGEQGNV